MGIPLKKREILEFMDLCGVTRPIDLMEEFGYTVNAASQILTWLKRQRLVINDRRGEWVLTEYGFERLIYWMDKLEEEAERKEREAIEERKQSGMYLYQVIAEGLPRDIEERICGEFNIMSIEGLCSESLNEIALPEEIWEGSGLLTVSRERQLGDLELPFAAWTRVLEHISKPAPKPQYLSTEEMLMITALPKQTKGEFLVTRDGEVRYDPGEGYLTMEAAVILAEYRKSKRTR